MQCSSETIGTIAAALAKAQAELTNPEKSLTASIKLDGAGAADRSFRYAPLSSGLEIVRKTLGQHAIATLQSTSIDREAGLIRLTTILAHSSGEWVSSDWPVCSLDDIASPKQMGAALTYARRYALFTLVGIAGEDDLDAPDLNAPMPSPSGAEKAATNNGGALNGGQGHPPRQASGWRGARAISKFAKPILEVVASAALRDQLLGELKGVGSSEDAALWAHRILGEKNSLTATDAAVVEDAFRVRLAALENVADINSAESGSARSSPAQSSIVQPPAGTAVGRGVDKSQLAHPEPRRLRDKEHVKFVAKQACLICGRIPSDPHHLRFAQHRALGRKVSDEFTIPLCRGHHREVHRCGDEAGWWEKAAIDPTVPARALWLESHPLPKASYQVTIDGADSATDVYTHRNNSSRHRQISKPGRNYKTKPIIGTGAR